MDLPESPSARARRRLGARVLLLILLVLVAGRAAGVVLRRRPPPPPPTPLSPMGVDLARDPASRLLFLPGIGRKRAAAIVRDRRRNGPVGRVRDLVRIPGIGEGTVRALEASRAVPVLVHSPPGGEGEAPR